MNAVPCIDQQLQEKKLWTEMLSDKTSDEQEGTLITNCP